MAYNIVHYRQDNAKFWGVQHEGLIYPLPTAYKNLGEFIEKDMQRYREFQPQDNDNGIEPSVVELLSPVTKPCRVVCQGLNYRDHVLETGGNPDNIGFNTIFRKSSSAIAPPNAKILRPSHVSLLDYEIELGIVIGREINAKSDIDEDTLGEYIAGIVLVNDISARDIQLPQGQWYKGKSYPTFCPVGPVLCVLDPDEAGLLKNLELELRVNNKIRQRSNTGELIFSPAETLSELATFMVLSPGDLLLTGTPGGVALKPPPPLVRKIAGLFLDEPALMKLFVRRQARRPEYLKDGDVIESRIRSLEAGIDLGMQQNVVSQVS